jgi:hypothetical protein
MDTVVGFSHETINYLLGGVFRASYRPLNDNIINGRIRGIAGVVGCNNARVTHDDPNLTLIKELIKNDVIVLATGCSAMTAGKAYTGAHGVLLIGGTPFAAVEFNVKETRGVASQTESGKWGPHKEPGIVDIDGTITRIHIDGELMAKAFTATPTTGAAETLKDHVAVSRGWHLYQYIWHRCCCGRGQCRFPEREGRGFDHRERTDCRSWSRYHVGATGTGV